MASSQFAIRIKTPAGQYTISDLSSQSTVKDLKEKIKKLTDMHQERIQIYCGYPPKPVSQNENEHLGDLNIRSGDSLIIRSEYSQDTAIVPEVENSSPNHESNDLNSVPVILDEPMSINRDDVLSSSNGIMMRIAVPSNNSCLFTSIYYILNNDKADYFKTREYRRIIAEVISKDPVKYNSAYLSKENNDYCCWIMDHNNWGGAIELAIFSEYFRIEICAIDIISCTMHRFGQEKDYEKRGILIYDGIHYDPLIMHLENEERTMFPTSDDRPLEMAMEIAKEAQSSRQFTDVANFKLKCNVCDLSLRGEQEASAHATATGHAHFGELNS